MDENAEYCDGQDFVVVFTAHPPTIYPGGFQLWRCKRCAYQFTQHPISDEKPPIPAYHPKPIPTYFTVSEEQKARLKTILRMEEEAKKRGNDRPSWEYMDIIAKNSGEIEID